MKTYFEEPVLTLVLFEAKDILTTSNKDGDQSEEEFDLFP